MKILAALITTLTLLNASVAYATEKFEVTVDAISIGNFNFGTDQNNRTIWITVTDKSQITSTGYCLAYGSTAKIIYNPNGTTSSGYTAIEDKDVFKMIYTSLVTAKATGKKILITLDEMAGCGGTDVSITSIDVPTI
jgi:filamentous hemagglutinin family protein